MQSEMGESTATDAPRSSSCFRAAQADLDPAVSNYFAEQQQSHSVVEAQHSTEPLTSTTYRAGRQSGPPRLDQSVTKALVIALK